MFIYANSNPYADYVTSDTVRDSVMDAAQSYLKRQGWQYDDIADYLFVESELDHYGRIRVEVRCELSYEDMEDMLLELDQVIQENFDSSAYFEPVEPGIAEAYISL